MIQTAQAIAFNLLKKLIRLKFPAVREMTTVEFAEAVEETTPLLILDARSEAEYEVSHLVGAVRVDVTADLAIASALKNISKKTPIVVYCSVGYRSAKVAQRLQQEGFQTVFNLEGGLFMWANKARRGNLLCPKLLIHDGQPTQWVHPYSAVWGMLLNKEHRF